MSDYLPQDLLVRIFTKLPVKSLLRFRTLSKSWCSIISSPGFIRKHTLDMVKTTQKVLIRNNIIGGKDIYTLHQEDQLPVSSAQGHLDGEGYVGVTAVEFPRVEVQIAGSCNGMLFLVDMSLGMCLWNFSVRRQLMIPSHPLRSRSTEMTVGFGFDPVINDYKILTIHYGDTLRVYIYTINTASWTAISPPDKMFYHLRCDSCLVNKTLYWLASESPKDTPHCVIMTFDLSTHEFGTVSLPETSWKFRQGADFNGSLAVMCTKDNDLCIWVKTESSWSVFLKLESPQFIAGPIFQPTSDGDLFMQTFPGFQTDREARVYNTRTGVLSKLSRFKAYCNIHMVKYVESLELLDRGTPCGEAFKRTEKKKT